MRYELLIAKRFLKQTRDGFSHSLTVIAIWSIAMAVLVMILSISILHGFQHNIEEKIIGFGSHITIRSQDIGHYYEEVPIQTTRPDFATIAHTPGVAHIQGTAQKGCIIKTDNELQGGIFKGIDYGYDTNFLYKYLHQGRLPAFLQHSRTMAPDSLATPSTEILISQSLADKLLLHIGDKVRTYFWQGDTYRARAFTLVGIYKTDMPELDDHFIIGDLRQVQRLNQWQPDEVSTWEITVNNFAQLNTMADRLYQIIDYDLTLSTIVESTPATFAWLELLNSNIVLILIIMAIVCLVAIVSALLIMIFEKTQMIGILKTLGATNASIRRLFLVKALSLTGKGVAIGAGIALVLSAIQQLWHPVQLDSESYSMSYVPVEIDVWIYLGVALLVFAVSLIAILLATIFITKLEPAKSIRFE